MNIGQCSICLGNYTANDMGVLRACMHTFHRECIGRAVRIRRECPLCRAEAGLADIASPLVNAGPVPKNLSKEALDIALGYYDKIVLTTGNGAPEKHNKCGGLSTSSSTVAWGEQREQLEACLQSLLSTIEDNSVEKEEHWQKLLDFIKLAGIASICAILALLCYLYWPLIAPIGRALASQIWSLIQSLRNFLRAYQPELVAAIFGLMELFIVWSSPDVVDGNAVVVEEQEEEEDGDLGLNA